MPLLMAGIIVVIFSQGISSTNSILVIDSAFFGLPACSIAVVIGQELGMKLGERVFLNPKQILAEIDMTFFPPGRVLRADGWIAQRTKWTGKP